MFWQIFCETMQSIFSLFNIIFALLGFVLLIVWTDPDENMRQLTLEGVLCEFTLVHSNYVFIRHHVSADKVQQTCEMRNKNKNWVIRHSKSITEWMLLL